MYTLRCSSDVVLTVSRWRSFGVGDRLDGFSSQISLHCLSLMTCSDRFYEGVTNEIIMRDVYVFMCTGASGFCRSSSNANAYLTLRRRRRQTQLPITSTADPRGDSVFSQEFPSVEEDDRRPLPVCACATLPGDDVVAGRKSGDDG